MSKYNSESKVWSGVEHQTIYNANVSLGYLILEVLKKTPERITQVFADKDAEMTCYEMRVRTIKIANYLTKCGFKQGDVVGIMATNSENLASIIFACFTLGLPINTLAPIMTESDIVHMYSKTKPKIIFCDGNVVETVCHGVDKSSISPVIVTLNNKVAGHSFVDDIVSGDYDVDSFAFPELNDVANSTAIILCSSGTTGSPKGVCKSHSQVINQMFPMWDHPLASQEVYFNFSTVYWATGFIFLLTGTLYGAKRIITSKPFDVKLMIEIIDRYKVTTCLLPTPAVASLVKSKELKPLKSILLYIVTGSIVSKSLCEAIQPFLPNGEICPVYGSSEGDFIADSFHSRRYGSVGQLSPNIKMKIIDEADNNLGPNFQGEVCFQTSVKFSGYFADPEKTAEAFDGDWILSGDIGFFDDDGFLYIVDRKKDMLKVNNYQVYPSELEDIINGIDGVVSSCVLGIFEDDTGNDLIIAFVIKDKNCEELTEDFILNFVHDKVIDAKKLRGGVHFMDAFPMTPSGKIQKAALKKTAQMYHTRIQ